MLHGSWLVQGSITVILNSLIIPLNLLNVKNSAFFDSKTQWHLIRAVCHWSMDTVFLTFAGSVSLTFEISSEVKIHIRDIGHIWHAGVHTIRHFACYGDFYVFRNHLYKTFIEPFDLSQNFQNHEHKTVFRPCKFSQ